MLYYVTIGERTLRVELTPTAVRVDGVDLGPADLTRPAGASIRHLLLGHASVPIFAHHDADGAWDLHVRGRTYRAEVVDERARAIRALTQGRIAVSGPRALRAPMPGLLVRVSVAVGERVAAGAAVATMEAMKMENELKAETAGVVARVLVQPGDAVEKGALLVEFEPAPDEPGKGTG